MEIREHSHFESVHQALYKIFFDLQSQIEREAKDTGVISYIRYAELLWAKLGQSKDDPRYAEFQSALVREMKHVPMSDLVDRALQYPDQLRALLQLPGSIALWTTGDASVTKYQRWKVLQSRVGENIQSVMGDDFPSSLTPRSFLKDGAAAAERGRIVSIVADDKMESLRNHLRTSRPSKVVVIEDSRKNIDTVRKLVAEIDPSITVHSAWYTSTREGSELRKSDEVAFAEAAGKYSGISSMAELLDARERIQPDDQTLWLVDFDGVVADNIAMRERQMEAKMSAIQSVFPAMKTEEDVLTALKSSEK